MNSLSVGRLVDLNLIYAALMNVYMDNEAEWPNMSQQDVFAKAMKQMGKKVNPSTLQTAIEQLEKFQLPRNVQEQEHTIGQI